MYRALRIGFALPVLAATASAEHFRFQYHDRDDGLNTAVGQVLQDRAGFLWIATGNGLFRYDGARFLQFGVKDGLPSPSIRRLHESNDGTLWIVTGGGLARLRHGAFEIVTSTGRSSLSAINSSRNGMLYLGSNQGLLAAPAPAGGMPQFQLVSGAPAASVPSIYVESNGVAWFACGRNLCRLDARDRVHVLGKADGLPDEPWGAILRDRAGNLWVRGPQHLYMCPAGAQRFLARDAGLPQSSNIFMAMLLDRDGTLLVSTDRGLARRVNETWQLIGSAQGLESEAITSLLQARDGSLWLGSWGGGIARWLGYGEWANWTMADGLSNNLVWAIRRHPNGTLWVGTDHGLNWIEGSSKPRAGGTAANGPASEPGRVWQPTASLISPKPKPESCGSVTASRSDYPGSLSPARK